MYAIHPMSHTYEHEYMISLLFDCIHTFIHCPETAYILITIGT